MAKIVSSLKEMQAALHDPSNYEHLEEEDGTVLSMPPAVGKWDRFWSRVVAFIQNLPDTFQYVMNVFLNIMTVAIVVALVAFVSVVGDRLYLESTNTGSSQFEAFLEKQGYHEQALAFRQQNEICQDYKKSLDVCKKAAWLYIHPEIAVWPDKNKPADTIALAKLPTSGD